jgi:hypothetical protein
LGNLSKRLITPKYKSVALLYGVVLISLFIISIKLTVGQELMPPMDTGAIAKIPHVKYLDVAPSGSTAMVYHTFLKKYHFKCQICKKNTNLNSIMIKFIK